MCDSSILKEEYINIKKSFITANSLLPSTKEGGGRFNLLKSDSIKANAFTTPLYVQQITLMRL